MSTTAARPVLLHLCRRAEVHSWGAVRGNEPVAVSGGMQ